MQELLKKTAGELSQLIRNKEISAKELLDLTFERIEQKDGTIGAFNSLTKEIAYETAKTVDEKVKNGEELPKLAGIPLALKDNMNMKNSYTTASSKILKDFKSPYDSTVAVKLKDNLVPVIGKANMDEFAMGSSNENSATKVVTNPWNTKKVPGGSSGGGEASPPISSAPPRGKRNRNLYVPRSRTPDTGRRPRPLSRRGAPWRRCSPPLCSHSGRRP